MWAVIGIALLAAGCGRIAFAPERDDAAPIDDMSGADAPDALGCAITDDLAGHWTFDSDQVTATQVLDSSGNNRHGNFVGTPAPFVSAGHIAEGLDFTATTTSYINLPSVPLDGTPGAFNSISMWFFENDPTPDEVLVYLPEAGGAVPPRYDLWYYDSVVPTLCINAGDSECWGAAPVAPVGRWIHVVAVFINGLETGSLLYIDGVDAGATCVFGLCDEVRSAMGPFRIAGSESVFAWHGKLDDVRVYKRALTPTEVARLYACAP